MTARSVPENENGREALLATPIAILQAPWAVRMRVRHGPGRHCQQVLALHRALHLFEPAAETCLVFSVLAEFVRELLLKSSSQSGASCGSLTRELQRKSVSWEPRGPI